MTARQVLERLSPAHFAALIVYTGPAFPLMNVLLRFRSAGTRAAALRFQARRLLDMYLAGERTLKDVPVALREDETIRDLLANAPRKMTVAQAAKHIDAYLDAAGPTPLPAELGDKPRIRELTDIPHQNMTPEQLAEHREWLHAAAEAVLPDIEKEAEEKAAALKEPLDAAVEALLPAMEKEMSAHTAMVLDALTQLPPARGEVWRGTRSIGDLTSGIGRLISPTFGGSRISLDDFASFSRVEDKALDFMAAAARLPLTHPVLIHARLTGNWGRDISFLSATPEEKEVLLLPGARMAIADRRTAEKTVGREPTRIRFELIEAVEELPEFPVRESGEPVAAQAEASRRRDALQRLAESGPLLRRDDLKPLAARIGAKTGLQVWQLAGLTSDIHGGPEHISVDRLAAVRRTADLARRTLKLGGQAPVTAEHLDALVRRLDGAAEDAAVDRAARQRLVDLVAQVKVPGRRVTYSELAAAWTTPVEHHHEEAAVVEPSAEPDTNDWQESLQQRFSLDAVVEVTHLRELPLDVDGLRLRESATEGSPEGSHWEVVDVDGAPLPGVLVIPRERGGFVVTGHGVGASHFAADGRFLFRTVALSGTDRVVRLEAPTGVAGPRLAERDGLPSGQATAEFSPAADGGLVVRLPDVGEWHFDADGRLWHYELPLAGERAVHEALPPLPGPAPDGLWLRSVHGPDGEVSRLDVVDADRSPVPDRVVVPQPDGGVTITAAAGDVRWNLGPERQLESYEVRLPGTDRFALFDGAGLPLVVDRDGEPVVDGFTAVPVRDRSGETSGVVVTRHAPLAAWRFDGSRASLTPLAQWRFDHDGSLVSADLPLTGIDADSSLRGLRVRVSHHSGEAGPQAHQVFELAGTPAATREFRVVPLDGDLADRLPGGFSVVHLGTGQRWPVDADGHVVSDGIENHPHAEEPAADQSQLPPAPGDGHDGSASRRSSEPMHDSTLPERTAAEPSIRTAPSRVQAPAAVRHDSQPLDFGGGLVELAHQEGGFYKLDNHDVFISVDAVHDPDEHERQAVYDQVRQYFGDGLTVHRGISSWHPTWHRVRDGEIPPLGTRPHPDYDTRNTNFVPFTANRDIATMAAMGHTGMGAGDDRRFVPGYDPADPTHPVGMVLSKRVSAATGEPIAFINPGETQVGGPIRDFDATTYDMGTPLSAVYGGDDDGMTLGAVMPPKPEPHEVAEYVAKFGGLRHDPNLPAWQPPAAVEHEPTQDPGAASTKRIRPLPGAVTRRIGSWFGRGGAKAVNRVAATGVDLATGKVIKFRSSEVRAYPLVRDGRTVGVTFEVGAERSTPLASNTFSVAAQGESDQVHLTLSSGAKVAVHGSTLAHVLHDLKMFRRTFEMEHPESVTLLVGHGGALAHEFEQALSEATGHDEEVTEHVVTPGVAAKWPPLASLRRAHTNWRQGVRPAKVVEGLTLPAIDHHTNAPTTFHTSQVPVRHLRDKDGTPVGITFSRGEELHGDRELVRSVFGGVTDIYSAEHKDARAENRTHVMESPWPRNTLYVTTHGYAERFHLHLTDGREVLLSGETFGKVLHDLASFRHIVNRNAPEALALIVCEVGKNDAPGGAGYDLQQTLQEMGYRQPVVAATETMSFNRRYRGQWNTAIVNGGTWRVLSSGDADVIGHDLWNWRAFDPRTAEATPLVRAGKTVGVSFRTDRAELRRRQIWAGHGASAGSAPWPHRTFLVDAEPAPGGRMVVHTPAGPLVVDGKTFGRVLAHTRAFRDAMATARPQALALLTRQSGELSQPMPGQPRDHSLEFARSLEHEFGSVPPVFAPTGWVRLEAGAGGTPELRLDHGQWARHDLSGRVFPGVDDAGLRHLIRTEDVDVAPLYHGDHQVGVSFHGQQASAHVQGWFDKGAAAPHAGAPWTDHTVFVAADGRPDGCGIRLGDGERVWVDGRVLAQIMTKSRAFVDIMHGIGPDGHPVRDRVDRFALLVSRAGERAEPGGAARDFRVELAGDLGHRQPVIAPGGPLDLLLDHETGRPVAGLPDSAQWRTFVADRNDSRVLADGPLVAGWHGGTGLRDWFATRDIRQHTLEADGRVIGLTFSSRPTPEQTWAAGGGRDSTVHLAPRQKLGDAMAAGNLDVRPAPWSDRTFFVVAPTHVNLFVVDIGRGHRVLAGPAFARLVAESDAFRRALADGANDVTLLVSHTGERGGPVAELFHRTLADEFGFSGRVHAPTSPLALIPGDEHGGSRTVLHGGEWRTFPEGEGGPARLDGDSPRGGDGPRERPFVSTGVRSNALTRDDRPLGPGFRTEPPATVDARRAGAQLHETPKRPPMPVRQRGVAAAPPQRVTLADFLGTRPSEPVGSHGRSGEHVAEDQGQSASRSHQEASAVAGHHSELLDFGGGLVEPARRAEGFYKLVNHDVFVSVDAVHNLGERERREVFEQVRRYFGEGLTLYRGIGSWHPTWHRVQDGEIPPLGVIPVPDYDTRNTSFVPFSADKDIATMAALSISGMGEGDNGRFVVGYDPADAAHPVGWCCRRRCRGHG
ncbi:hypothetical protein GCM10018954_097930 [Kutzneria kofuensis]